MRSHFAENDENIQNSIATLRELLVEDGMPIGHWAATARWALTRHLTLSFATGGVTVANPSNACHSAPQARASFAKRYRRHVGDWTPGRIDNEWPLYCQELLAILNVLDRHQGGPDIGLATAL